jgi:hypothetical protein
VTYLQVQFHLIFFYLCNGEGVRIVHSDGLSAGWPSNEAVIAHMDRRYLSSP